MHICLQILQVCKGFSLALGMRMQRVLRVRLLTGLSKTVLLVVASPGLSKQSVNSQHINS